MEWICSGLPSTYFYCKSCVNVPNCVPRYTMPSKWLIVICSQWVDQADYCVKLRYQKRLCALASSPVIIALNPPVSSCVPLNAPAPRSSQLFLSGFCIGTANNTQMLLDSKMAFSLQTIWAYSYSFNLASTNETHSVQTVKWRIAHRWALRSTAAMLFSRIKCGCGMRWFH